MATLQEQRSNLFAALQAAHEAGDIVGVNEISQDIDKLGYVPENPSLGQSLRNVQQEYYTGKQKGVKEFTGIMNNPNLYPSEKLTLGGLSGLSNLISTGGDIVSTMAGDALSNALFDEEIEKTTS